MDIKLKKFNLFEYLMTIDVLNEDQFDKDSKIPRKKKDRSREFIISRYKKVLKLTNDLPIDIMEDELFLSFFIDAIDKQMIQLDEIVKAASSKPVDGKIKDGLVLSHEFLNFQEADSWSFLKWVKLEEAAKREISITRNGEKYTQRGYVDVMAVCFGEFKNPKHTLKYKYELISQELPAEQTLSNFVQLNVIINKIKNGYKAIYDFKSSEGESNNLSTHLKHFGWYDTLYSLADKGTFGTLSELKAWNTYDVLGYLNCTVSRENAKQIDYEEANKK